GASTATLARIGPATATFATVRGLSAQTFDSVLNLFERSFHDRLDRLFLVSRKCDVRLRKEFFHRIHRVRLWTACLQISASEEIRGRTTACSFFLSQKRRRE